MLEFVLQYCYYFLFLIVYPLPYLIGILFYQFEIWQIDEIYQLFTQQF